MLRVDDISKKYTIKVGRGRFEETTVLKNVSFELKMGEVLGIVGENGSGKSTLAKILMALLGPSSGRVLFESRDIFKMKKRELLEFRKDVQIVWQSPDTTLNPTMTVCNTLLEPLKIHNLSKEGNSKNKIDEVLGLVGLESEHLEKYPHQLSGGERQRIAIARSLMVEPKVLILDEPLSQLDAALRLRLIETLIDIKEKRGISYVYISHDLASLRLLSDRVLIFSSGSIERELSIEEILSGGDLMYFEDMASFSS